MDRWTRVGWVVLVVGLVLLASSATGMERELVGMATLRTNVESQTEDCGDRDNSARVRDLNLLIHPPRT